MTRTQVSLEGLAALTEQLAQLQTERKQLGQEIAEARQLKDAEEFDLIDEMTRLALLDKKIAETSHLLSRCSTLQASAPQDGTVQLGTSVKLETPQGVMNCKVVSAVEADPATGRISDASPLGAALLGKAREALINVRGPRQLFTYRIVGVGA